ncbi:hypothetical protein EAE99_004161 [Botrytis elliptica]|nr:hypothetical protein EAE99_004161 [Botrytis elliptica]
MGMSYTDPTRPNQQNSRGLRLITGPTSGYDLIFPFQTIKAKYSQGTHSTNLELFDWVVEVSGIILYKPIVTDLKPSKLDTTEYPAQNTSSFLPRSCGK